MFPFRAIKYEAERGLKALDLDVNENSMRTNFPVLSCRDALSYGEALQNGDSLKSRLLRQSRRGRRYESYESDNPLSSVEFAYISSLWRT